MKISTIVLLLILASIIISCTSNEDYAKGILEERKEKDEFMKNSDESPLANDSTEFSGLKYYAPDIRYRVNSSLETIENKKVITLATSTGEANQYLEYAWAVFEMDGVTCKLLLLEVMDMGPTRGTLFVAFSDETSARETYGAGRYLELKKAPGAGTLVLDFNKAYNPYCAYSENYSCPFPPKENILAVAIKAGEKNYH